MSKINIQVGKAQFQTNATVKTVYFDTTFENIPTVVTSQINDDEIINSHVNTTLLNITKTSFDIILNSPMKGLKIHYQAFGKE